MKFIVKVDLSKQINDTMFRQPVTYKKGKILDETERYNKDFFEGKTSRSQSVINLKKFYGQQINSNGASGTSGAYSIMNSNPSTGRHVQGGQSNVTTTRGSIIHTSAFAAPRTNRTNHYDIQRDATHQMIPKYSQQPRLGVQTVLSPFEQKVVSF